jgi:hypothetical protein
VHVAPGVGSGDMTYVPLPPPSLPPPSVIGGSPGAKPTRLTVAVGLHILAWRVATWYFYLHALGSLACCRSAALDGKMHTAEMDARAVTLASLAKVEGSTAPGLGDSM